MLMPRMRNDEFFKIKIEHMPTGKETEFEGWVTEFNDKFTSDWTPTKVYGRMDPLATFTGTSRTISLGFDVVSDSLQMARKNLHRVNQLITFLYPVYQQSSNASRDRQGKTLQAAPLIGLKWANLITDAAASGQLIGYLGGLSYNPDMSQGGFGYSYENAVEMPFEERRWMGQYYNNYDDDPTDTTISHDTRETHITNQSLYIPKKLSLSFEFTVLHQHLNGWRYDSMNDGYVFGDRYVNDSYPHMPSTKTIETATTFIHEVTPAAEDFTGLPAADLSSPLPPGDGLGAPMALTFREPGPIIRQRAIDILDRDYGIED